MRRRGNRSMYETKSYQQLLLEDQHFRAWCNRHAYNEATVGKRAMAVAAESWQACARTLAIRSDDLSDVMKSVSEEREKKLEMFALAFLAETGLQADECELVQETIQELGQERIIFYFRTR